MVLQSIIYSLAAYVLGSIPFGKLISARVARIDITRRGSGNVGATNVARELGLKWGLLTLVLDMMKGFVPVSLFAAAASTGGTLYAICLSAVGLSALIGHQFSIFMGFRGGKGVATALGVFLALSPLSCLIGLLIFVVVVAIWDFISLGSMVSAISLAVLMGVLGKPFPIVLGGFAAAALICVKHHENIGRLLKGEERKWRERSSQPRTSSNLSNSSSE
ncbi:MAG: glycerol-3-phosphate 1-O-acyltransferase PlsY [Deltaproteobacteria bacterium]|nr:glycerol-3-phosphate 1-O-acyltransferase PlsY [Deltaproteobacteria bacterium]MBW1815621.1 glycerol-3-phosphate 1-O-acyltransferase PlsY [Deltaproteobacteria bacterium]MBW2283015.1 glycerol-3-phosphate 1-O-acyltransferase PlsY [Deltaproteobacteria bacterium]